VDCFEGYSGLTHYRVSRTADLWHWYTQVWDIDGPYERQSRPYLDADSAMAGAQQHFEEVGG
jgi:hypothetical protein